MSCPSGCQSGVEVDAYMHTLSNEEEKDPLHFWSHNKNSYYYYREHKKKIRVNILSNSKNSEIKQTT